MTRRSSRLLSSTMFAGLFAGLAFVCAANAPEAEGSASEAIITKCAPGYSPTCDVCEPEDGCLKRVVSCHCEADPPPPPACPVNPQCTSKPKDTPGFDGLMLDATHWDDAFADQLAAAGCATERSYKLGDGNEYAWATAICPDTLTLSSVDAASGRAGTLGCDSCTGTPGPHQVVIAWIVGQCLPPRCLPQGNCGNVACLKQEQQDDTGGTP